LGEIEVKLFCGHAIADAEYNKMFRAHLVRCPVDGLEWRGTMTIQRDKTLPKRELRWELQRQYEREKGRNRK